MTLLLLLLLKEHFKALNLFFLLCLLFLHNLQWLIVLLLHLSLQFYHDLLLSISAFLFLLLSKLALAFCTDSLTETYLLDTPKFQFRFFYFFFRRHFLTICFHLSFCCLTKSFHCFEPLLHCSFLVFLHLRTGTFIST